MMTRPLERKAFASGGTAAVEPARPLPAPAVRAGRHEGQILQHIAEGTASKVGPDFFTSLAANLAGALEVRLAIITELLDDPPTRVRALAAAGHSSSEELIEYEIAGTPTGEVLRSGSAFYPDDVCGSFPADLDLKALDVVSYCGLVLKDSSERVIGHLAILDDSPMRPGIPDLPALRIFAARAAAELERQRMERALQESHAKLRTIIEGTSDVIYLQDLQGRYLLINPAGAAALGLAEEEVIGKTDADLFPQEQARVLQEENETVTRTGKPIMNEVTVTLSGEAHHYQTNKAPHRDRKGRIVGVIGVCRNITDLKRNTERMKITERMASIGTLAAGIAHEINNPLTAIQVSAQTALESSRSGGQGEILSECLESINEATERAGRIVRSVLQLSRDGNSPKEPESLLTVARRVRDLTRVRASARGVTIELESPPELRPALINVLEMEQALINVVANAIDASSEGMAVTISIAESESCLQILVSDPGRGMSPELAGRVFDPFFTTRQGEGGTGLGMSITHAIVRQHQGSIRIDSSPGKGTTVTICLPPADGDPCDEACP